MSDPLLRFFASTHIIRVSDMKLARWHMIRFSLVALVLALNGCASKGVEVWLWSDAEVSDAFDQDSALQPHPCGTIERKTLSTLPAVGEKGFEPGSEPIVEHDGSGEIVRAWNAPMEPEVIGIDGDVIFLDYGDDALSIDGKGNIRKVEKLESPREYVEDCPVRAMDGEYSRFLCWNLKDRTTDQFRYLAYSIVCT